MEWGRVPQISFDILFLIAYQVYDNGEHHNPLYDVHSIGEQHNHITLS